MKILAFLLILIFSDVFGNSKLVFDKRPAEKVMQKNRQKFSHCYQKELKQNSEYREGVVLIWDIDSQGLGQNFAVSNSTTNNPALHRCLLDALQKLKFPVGKNFGIGHMIYPMILSGEKCEW